MDGSNAIEMGLHGSGQRFSIVEVRSESIVLLRLRFRQFGDHATQRCLVAGHDGHAGTEQGNLMGAGTTDSLRGAAYKSMFSGKCLCHDCVS